MQVWSPYICMVQYHQEVDLVTKCQYKMQMQLHFYQSEYAIVIWWIRIKCALWKDINCKIIILHNINRHACSKCITETQHLFLQLVSSRTQEVPAMINRTQVQSANSLSLFMAVSCHKPSHGELKFLGHAHFIVALNLGLDL